MDTVDKEYEIMEHGIKALLKQESYGEPELAGEPCKHISDGFVYEDNPIFVTMQCVKCRVQYDVSKLTGMLI